MYRSCEEGGGRNDLGKKIETILTISVSREHAIYVCDAPAHRLLRVVYGASQHLAWVYRFLFAGARHRCCRYLSICVEGASRRHRHVLREATIESIFGGPVSCALAALCPEALSLRTVDIHFSLSLVG